MAQYKIWARRGSGLVGRRGPESSPKASPITRAGHLWFPMLKMDLPKKWLRPEQFLTTSPTFVPARGSDLLADLRHFAQQAGLGPLHRSLVFHSQIWDEEIQSTVHSIHSTNVQSTVVHAKYWYSKYCLKDRCLKYRWPKCHCSTYYGWC